MKPRTSLEKRGRKTEDIVKRERQPREQDRSNRIRMMMFLAREGGAPERQKPTKTLWKLGHLVTFGSDPQVLRSEEAWTRDARSRPSLGERTERGWLLVEASSMHLTVLRTGRCGGGGSLIPRVSEAPSCREDELRPAGHRGKGILRVPRLGARASVHRGPSSKLHPSLATGG